MANYPNVLGDTVFEKGYVALDDTTGVERVVRFTTDGANRWFVGIDANDDFFIDRFNAFGIQTHSLNINRSTNLETLFGALKLGSAAGPQLISDGSGNLWVKNAAASAFSNVTMADLAAVTGTFTGKVTTPAATLTLSSFKITPGVAPTSNMVEGDFYYDSTAHVPYFRNASAWIPLSSGGVAPAPSDATYITQTANSTLSAEQALSSLSTGLMKVTTTTGVISSITTSAGVLALISDATGSGVMVFNASPTLTTPTIANFTNANHTHQNAANGGTLDASAVFTASTKVGLAFGGTNADLSGTGAANSFLKQSSSGAAITVGTIASADINTALTTPGPIGSGTANTGDFTSLTTSTSTPLTMTYVGAGAWNAIVGKRALAGPAAVTAGTELISLNTNPYNGSAYASSATARILAGAAETHSGSAAGTYWDFYVTLAGGTTLRRALLIQHDGSFQTTAWTSDTAVVGDIYLVTRSSTGTPAANYGAGFVLRLDSTTTQQYAARWRTFWTTATNASRKARVVLSAFDTAERDCILMEASGSAAMLGFYGTAPITKPAPTGSRAGNAALASLLTALANLGLITDSTSA